MKKPMLKIFKKGMKGNEFNSYEITVDGEKYYHTSKEDALRQYNAAVKVYTKRLFK